MGQLDEDICRICVEPVRFYSMYNRQKCYFCSPLCHQEYNSRQVNIVNEEQTF
ncbi:hypothetical protein HOLleu_14647 [Holothuria leucospilota]|uniref:Uncharacterized protein n=1 Tax=Holothuria leucospilota TaxID=206669 RepID=A0A9Q1H933_HOLLE|nr:hypothetical protein HOLleu_14647 [Holothuria leucospilota]